MVPEHDTDPGAAHAAEPVADSGAASEWLTVAQAARHLGCSERAVRKRVDRGRLEVRRERSGNRVRTLVRVSGAAHAAEPVTARAAGPVADPGAELVAELRARVAHLEDEVGFLRAELARRRWPGLKVWWRRFWKGHG
jgi:hypothetical protein